MTAIAGVAVGVAVGAVGVVAAAVDVAAGAVVVAAVNEIESLAAMLSQKIWQKITILDQRRDEMEEPPRADAGQRAAG